jgi:hypothetical protein
MKTAQQVPRSRSRDLEPAATAAGRGQLREPAAWGHPKATEIPHGPSGYGTNGKGPCAEEDWLYTSLQDLQEASAKTAWPSKGHAQQL